MTDRYKWDLPLTGTQSTKVRPRRFRYGMWLYDVRQLPPRLMRASTERLDRREVRQASVRDSAMSACAGFAWRLSLLLRVFCAAERRWARAGVHLVEHGFVAAAHRRRCA
jgi:hypothetical protein